MDERAVRLTRWVESEWLTFVGSIAANPAYHASALTNENHLTRAFESHLRRMDQEVVTDREPFKVGNQTRFPDLRVSKDVTRVAIELKYKLGYGAFPDNRKEAFIDLQKLEQYVIEQYADCGLFLWLTNQVAYTKEPRGDSRPYSTEHGRIYKPGTLLPPTRARREPIDGLTLANKYIFSWSRLAEPWWTLTLPVGLIRNDRGWGHPFDA